MRRPAWVEDMRFAPVGKIGTNGCDESGGCEADATRGDGLARHVVVQDIFECEAKMMSV